MSRLNHDHFLLAGRLILTMLCPLVGGMAFGQAGGPNDFDLKLIPDKKIVRQGDELNIDAAVAVRKAGVLGWSYGVEHDKGLFEIISASIVGSDLPSVFGDGFNQTKIISDAGGSKMGWIQAVVLSLGEERKELPISPRFVLAKAKYRVRSGICGQPAQIPTSIAFSNRLVVPPSPPVDINLVVETDSIEPAIKEAAEMTLDCPAQGALSLAYGLSPTRQGKLPADGQTTLPINVVAKNLGAAGTAAAEIQGWSYGLKLDPALLEVTDLTTGSHAAALNGGVGPDFRAYNFKPLDQSADGTVKGVSVGVVISLDPPDDALPVPAGEARNLELLTVKAAIRIESGQPDRPADLAFASAVLGGSRPIENILVVGGQEITIPSDPAGQPALSLVLTAPTVDKNFKRGDANSDGRFDIADAVFTIRDLFYSDLHLVCRKAADVNDDGRLDIADPIFIIDWQFRGSGKEPLAPYPNCGLDATADTLTCDQATNGCN